MSRSSERLASGLRLFDVIMECIYRLVSGCRSEYLSDLPLRLDAVTLACSQQAFGGLFGQLDGFVDIQRSVDDLRRVGQVEIGHAGVERRHVVE